VSTYPRIVTSPKYPPEVDEFYDKEIFPFIIALLNGDAYETAQ
jgi:hypothetical protein